MRILVFDTETTGLPEKKAGHNEYNKWPNIVQLSYLVYNMTDAQIAAGTPFSTLSPILVSDSVIKPTDYEVPQEASQIHGITHVHAMHVGIPAQDVLVDILAQVAIADVIVAHNCSFDKDTLHAVMYRCGMLPDSGRWKTKTTVREICTMVAGTSICRRSFASEKPYPFDNRTKWPRLEELFRTLFPHEGLPPSLHNSLVDVQLTARCFFAMVDMKIISLDSPPRVQLPEEVAAVQAPRIIQD